MFAMSKIFLSAKSSQNSSPNTYIDPNLEPEWLGRNLSNVCNVKSLLLSHVLSKIISLHIQKRNLPNVCNVNSLLSVQFSQRTSSNTYRRETFQMFAMSKIFLSAKSSQNSSPNTYIDPNLEPEWLGRNLSNVCNVRSLFLFQVLSGHIQDKFDLLTFISIFITKGKFLP